MASIMGTIDFDPHKIAIEGPRPDPWAHVRQGADTKVNWRYTEAQQALWLAHNLRKLSIQAS